MKKVVAILFLFLCLGANAQYQSENPKYMTVGSNVKFWPYIFDGNTYLVMQFTDPDDCSLTGNPIVKFKMKDESILKLKGLISNSETSSSAFKMGYTIINSSSTTHCVALPITKEEIEKLLIGVDKVSINSIPVVYKRSKWARKKSFGETLYKIFHNLKDDFEE